jgi:hypothetical protein
LKFLTNKKGQVRVIEAFLASLLLTGCIAIIPIYSNYNEPQNLNSEARNILTSLDSNGALAIFIDNENWQGLKNTLNAAIPITLWYNLTIFDENANILNPISISSSGVINENINSIDYMSVSPNSQFAVYILRLQISTVGYR